MKYSREKNFLMLGHLHVSSSRCSYMLLPVRYNCCFCSTEFLQIFNNLIKLGKICDTFIPQSEVWKYRALDLMMSFFLADTIILVWGIEKKSPIKALSCTLPLIMMTWTPLFIILNICLRHLWYLFFKKSEVSYVHWRFGTSMNQEKK